MFPRQFPVKGLRSFRNGEVLPENRLHLTSPCPARETILSNNRQTRIVAGCDTRSLFLTVFLLFLVLSLMACRADGLSHGSLLPEAPRPQATLTVPLGATVPSPTEDEWQIFMSPAWPITFKYPGAWRIVDEQGEPPRRYLLLRNEVPGNQGQIKSEERALIQLTLSHLEDESREPTTVLRAIVEEKHPARSGFFFDPEGKLDVSNYTTGHELSGLLGSVLSDVYFHNSFAFTHSSNNQPYLGIVDVMAQRPLTKNDETFLMEAFFHLIESIEFSP